MDIAALVTWIAAALGGGLMAATWLRHRGQPTSRPSRIPPALLFGHAGLAAVGLVVWIAVVATGSAALPWLALAIVVVVALGGFAMFARWLGDRGDEHAAPTPEQHFPVVVVVGHGLLGAVTLVLVLLVATGIG